MTDTPSTTPTPPTTAPDDRHLVVVDIESSGLRSEDIPVEVAWRDLDSGDGGRFIPEHDVTWVLEFGEPVALRLNDYRVRLATAPQDDGTEARRLFTALRGQCMAGSNPTFDAGHLEHVFTRADNRLRGLVDPFRDSRPWQPWHHRLPDVSNYAAGVLGLDPRRLPGLERVCTLLGVTVEGDVHTAESGVAAAAECFVRLQRIATQLHDSRRTIARWSATTGCLYTDHPSWPSAFVGDAADAVDLVAAHPGGAEGDGLATALAELEALRAERDTGPPATATPAAAGPLTAHAEQ